MSTQYTIAERRDGSALVIAKGVWVSPHDGMEGRLRDAWVPLVFGAFGDTVSTRALLDQIPEACELRAGEWDVFSADSIPALIRDAAACFCAG